MSRLPLSYLSRFKSGNLDKETLIISGCLRPRMLSVRPASCLQYTNMYVDCGKCLNCAANRRNDLVSRMCLHSLYHKYCYFVTLTYNSFDMTQYDEHPFTRLWLETLPTINDININGEFKPSPTICVYSHFSNFIKRLRLLVDDTISYVYCTEYGSRFGRPHAHFVFWCNSPITKDMVSSAWSIKCVCSFSDPRRVRKYRGQNIKDDEIRFDYLIGRVDYHDLVANGSLDFTTSDLSLHKDSCALKCFNYVASYLAKSSIETIGVAASRKLKFVFDLLPDSESLDLFDGDDKNNMAVYYKQFVYNNKYYEKISFSEFVDLVKPSLYVSRGESIGKRYFIENYARFSKGQFDLPQFFGKKLSFPSYYFYLLSLSRENFRFEKVSFLGRSYVKGNYHILLENLKLFSESPVLYHSKKNDHLVESFYSNSVNGDFLNAIIYFDLERYHVTYCPTFDVFDFYKYNSSTRSYDFQFYEERIDFLNFLIHKLDVLVADDRSLAMALKFELDQSRVDLIDKHPDIIDRFFDRYKYRQIFYNNNHKNSL